MRLSEFQARIIEDRLRIVSEDYKSEPDKRAGCIAGLELCRGKKPHELADILILANTALSRAFETKSPKYWEVAMFHAEIELVVDTVSAALQSLGLKPLIDPTREAYARAAQLLDFEKVAASIPSNRQKAN